MQILRTILTVIFAIDCIALTVVVLMQEGKQQGLGGAISGAAASYWGKNKGRSMEGGLVKATTIMAVLFFVLAAVLNLKVFAVSGIQRYAHTARYAAMRNGFTVL